MNNMRAKSTSVCNLMVKRQVHLSLASTARGSPDAASIVENEKRGLFRVLDLGKPNHANMARRPFEARRIKAASQPREKTMKPDQDWTSVWPAARTFHPASVPLPVRQGFAHLKGQVTPSKYVNVELMKVPNFLHLTPPAIKKHCEAIKKFCTKWPEGNENFCFDSKHVQSDQTFLSELNDVDTLNGHFPLVESTSDYLNSSSNIRDYRSRVVSLEFQLSSLFLDAASREKFLKLVGPDRYNEETDCVTITADRCPYRKQNREYCEYLVKALYYESRNREDWEADASVLDNLQYSIQEGQGENELEEKLAIVLNRGENPVHLEEYKNAALKEFKLKNELPMTST